MIGTDRGASNLQGSRHPYSSLGESIEQMKRASWELVVLAELVTIAEQPLDAIMVNDGQNDRCFANSAGANEGGRNEFPRKRNGRLDQLNASKTGPRCLRG